MHAYRTLQFDTRLFGFPVAYLAPRLPVAQLGPTLAELRAGGVRLAYWSIDSAERPAVEHLALELGGRLVDEKTTYTIDLQTLPLADEAPIATVEPYDPAMPAEQLEALAIQSGEYSRFALDPRIPREKFIELYTMWIRRSVSREIADEVLVIRGEGNNIAGMVTVGRKNGRGDIGLIAVDEAHRGRRYGVALVKAAQRWLAAHGHQHGQVVTQGTNAPACRLYEKCGYAVEKVEPYYHFWL